MCGQWREGTKEIVEQASIIDHLKYHLFSTYHVPAIGSGIFRNEHSCCNSNLFPFYRHGNRLREVGEGVNQGHID